MTADISQAPLLDFTGESACDLHDSKIVIHAGDGREQPGEHSGCVRRGSVVSHPFPDSGPGSRRTTHQSDGAEHPALDAAERRRSRRTTTDHVAYPTLPPTDGQHPQRRTAEEQASYAPYPAVAKPEAWDEDSGKPTPDKKRRVSWQTGPEVYPEEGGRSRRATADGRGDHVDDVGHGRVSRSGEQCVQQPSASAPHGRRATDTSGTGNYPPHGELPLHDCCSRAAFEFMLPPFAQPCPSHQVHAMVPTVKGNSHPLTAVRLCRGTIWSISSATCAAVARSGGVKPLRGRVDEAGGTHVQGICFQ